MKLGVEKAKADSSTAQEHVKMLQGVAVQQTSESYEKSMQQQTHILELKVSYLVWVISCHDNYI